MSDTQAATEPGFGARFVRRWRGWLIVLVLFLIAESATRIHQRAKFGTLGTYKPRHLVDFYRFYRVNPQFGSPTIQVNAQGFRDGTDLPKHKPRNELRVFVMGGSTVWGEDGEDKSGVGLIANKNTIAAHLGVALNRLAAARGDSVHVRVVNAGIVGYRIFQDLAFFDDYVSGFEPDLVIALDGHNDLDALALKVPFYAHRNDASFDAELNHPSALNVVQQAGRYLGTKSVFVRKATVRFVETVSHAALKSNTWQDNFQHPPADSSIAAFLGDYESTVRRFNASAEIAGAPILFSVQNELAGERQKKFTPAEVELRKHYEYYRWLHTDMHDRLVQRMDSLRQSRGIWFEDVTNVFANEPGQTYIDYTHLSDRGAEVLAERLASVVAPTLFCEAGGRPSARCAPTAPSPVASRAPQSNAVTSSTLAHRTPE